MRLWLDNIREPWKYGALGFTWVKTAREAIDYLKTGTVTFASLDHDLSLEQTMGVLKGYDIDHEIYALDSGYTVVCWLEQNPEYWPKEGCVVHSMNPAGRERMLQVIRRHYERYDEGTRNS